MSLLSGQDLPVWETLNLQQVLADSFETRFSPFTLETPRVSTSSYVQELCREPTS
jgi:hypothetical protein